MCLMNQSSEVVPVQEIARVAGCNHHIADPHTRSQSTELALCSVDSSVIVYEGPQCGDCNLRHVSSVFVDVLSVSGSSTLEEHDDLNCVD